MSGASDKARFFLEQSVPELKEWEKKKIFTPEEITSINKKRSDFEHKVNARGSSPSDYARYAEFEINVEALRKKRVKRMGIKMVSHSGQRRIFFLFDRATRKFPGDLGLWMQYIEYCRRQKSLKKLVQVLTATLRLHPQKAELWIYAARFSIDENADMAEARSYMQRGLRFCKNARNLWLEYTKLELLYIAKIAARRQILGIDKEQQEKEEEEVEDAGFDADMISLPKLTEEDINPDSVAENGVDEATLEKFEQSPVLSGGIPIAIFDASMKQFDHDSDLAKSFFDLVSDFQQINCQSRILGHIMQDMLENRKNDWQTQVCHVKIAVSGIQTDSPNFPSAFGQALGRIREYVGQGQGVSSMASELQQWLDQLLQAEDLDPALARVIQSAKLLLERS